MLNRIKVLAKCKDPECDPREEYVTPRTMVEAWGMPYCDQCGGEMIVTAIEANEQTYRIDRDKGKQ